jgi:hypothetical protein
VLQRGLSSFFCQSPGLLPLSCFIVSCLLSSHSQLAPLHAEHLPHHHHNLHLTLVWICLVSLCYHSSCLFLLSFQVYGFLSLRHIRFTKILSYQQGSFLSSWSSSSVSARLSACVSAKNAEVMFEWNVLTAPICKSRCGVRIVSYVLPPPL